MPTFGAIIAPETEPGSWEEHTGLALTHTAARDLSNSDTRMFADGMTSWVLRRGDGTTEMVVFDRAVSSERDLVIVGEAAVGVMVQRHPMGVVRMVGSFGVVRSTPGGWLHQPPVDEWLSEMDGCQTSDQQALLKRLLRFAVHDLGSRRIGGLLVFHIAPPSADRFEERLPAPPPLRVERPSNLAPLGHVLSQIDGAAIFDGDGVLTHLGPRLVPSRTAEQNVEPMGGTRHTTARRYSYDEPGALVIAISEDGPVTVFRSGEVLGRSRPDASEGVTVP